MTENIPTPPTTPPTRASKARPRDLDPTKVVEKYKEFKHLVKTSAHFGVSAPSISAILARAKEKPLTVTRPRFLDPEEVVKTYQERRNLIETGNFFGVSGVSVSTIIKAYEAKHGFKVRKTKRIIKPKALVQRPCKPTVPRLITNTDILETYKTRQNAKATAKALGISWRSVCKLVQRTGSRL